MLHTCTNTYTRVCIYIAYIHTNTHTHTHIYIYIHMYMQKYIYTHIRYRYICISWYILYIHWHGYKVLWGTYAQPHKGSLQPWSPWQTRNCFWSRIWPISSPKIWSSTKAKGLEIGSSKYQKKVTLRLPGPSENMVRVWPGQWHALWGKNSISIAIRERSECSMFDRNVMSKIVVFHELWWAGTVRYIGFKTGPKAMLHAVGRLHPAKLRLIADKSGRERHNASQC